MKKKLKLFILLPMVMLCSCSLFRVSSIITNKYDRHWIQTMVAGKVIYSIPKHDFYFQFNEVKPYTKQVEEKDYNKFEVGDTYTFAISKREAEYFFDSSVTEIKDN